MLAPFCLIYVHLLHDLALTIQHRTVADRFKTKSCGSLSDSRPRPALEDKTEVQARHGSPPQNPGNSSSEDFRNLPVHRPRSPYRLQRDIRQRRVKTCASSALQADSLAFRYPFCSPKPRSASLLMSAPNTLPAWHERVGSKLGHRGTVLSR